MELVIQILMLFIVLNTVLKLSFWRWWQAALFGVVCGAFVMAVLPAATQQSKSQLADFLANRTIMQDAAVLVTMEVSVCFAFCFLISRRIYGGALSRWGRVLMCYPGLLVFAVLFYLLTQTIYAMPGTDFRTIGWGVAAAATIGMPLMRWLVRKLLPEADFRVEVHFLVSLFVCLLGLIATVNGNVTYAAVEQPTDWRMLLTALLIFVAAFTAGAAWHKLKWVRLQRKR
ncbi:hypothetical protein LJC45_06055 [Alistipes sp. OttesenSCG-928-B03]|nr:hypothetical protein [Alistipes sp. OttesenSCG-928-B03]